ncbi:MAG TPA: hypothetical protein VGS19_16705 [Streptosporangiaceae bacterium]|nr:hypothetical protein [Streptosporangiaceae bacterium]
MPRKHLSRLAAAAAAATCFTGFAVPAASAATHAPGQSAASPAQAAGARSLLLITGDRLLMRPGSSHPAVVAPATGGGMIISWFCQQQAMVPVDALPYLGRGLDLSLFEPSALAHAEAGGRLPVRVAYQGNLPSLPGVTLTSHANGLASGYLTAASAARFGAALERQFMADHERGSYGGDGLFAGGTSLSLAGTAPTPAPAPRAFPMQTLTMTGTNLAGRPDTGDEVFVFNLDNCAKFGGFDAVSSFYHGTAKYSVPAGHYWAFGLFTNKQFPAFRIAVLPQFTVRHITTAHLSEQAATSEFSFATPHPATLDDTSLNLFRGSSQAVSAVTFFEFGAPMWVSPISHAPSLGTLHTVTTANLASAAGHATPYNYALSFAGAPGTIPPQSYTVSPASLATVHERFFSEVSSPGSWVTVGGPPQSGAAGGTFQPVSLPGTLVQYVSGGQQSLWSSLYGNDKAGTGGQSNVPQAFHAGQNVTEDWNAFPLHPAPNVSLPGTSAFPTQPSAVRAGNQLLLDITPFSDNTLGHLGSGFAIGNSSTVANVTGSYELDDNGVKIAGGTIAHSQAPDLSVKAPLVATPSQVKLSLTASRTGSQFLLSTGSQDVWTWPSRPKPTATVPAPWYCGVTSSATAVHYDRHCVVQDMMTLQYQVAGLSPTGTTKPGQQAFDLTVNHLQATAPARVTDAQIQVSYDDGATWHPATITRTGPATFHLTYTAPPQAGVTLRVNATDAHGATVAETITRAYQTSA